MARAPVPKKSKSAKPATRSRVDQAKEALETAQVPDTPVLIYEIFNGPVLLPNEDLLAHAAILQWVSDSIYARDITEIILVKDLTDAFWEAERIRKLRADYLKMLRVDQLVKIMTPYLPDEKGDVSRSHTRNVIDAHLVLPDGEERLNELVASVQKHDLFILANAFVDKFDELEKFDRSLERALKKRTDLLQQLEKRRESQYALSAARKAQRLAEAGGAK